jgi:hypothetical protein
MKKSESITRKGCIVLCGISSLFLTGGISPLHAAVAPVARDTVKQKFHETADKVNKETINQTVDQIADYFDKDKIKETIDTIADSLDKEKIKDMIDMIAEHLDRDKLKDMVDLAADYFDREKVKQTLDQLVDRVDKEAIKDKFDKTVDQVANAFDEAADFVYNTTAELGTDVKAIQNRLDQHNWKGLIRDKTTWDVATLSGLKLNGHKKVAIVKPGEQVQGEVICSLNRDKCSALSLYRVVVGIKNRGGPTTVCSHFGLRAGEEKDSFVLTAPKEKGVYPIGFRVVKSALETTALNQWEEKPNDPTPVVGLIVVN